MRNPIRRRVFLSAQLHTVSLLILLPKCNGVQASTAFSPDSGNLAVPAVWLLLFGSLFLLTEALAISCHGARVCMDSLVNRPDNGGASLCRSWTSGSDCVHSAMRLHRHRPRTTNIPMVTPISRCNSVIM